MDQERPQSKSYLHPCRDYIPRIFMEMWPPSRAPGGPLGELAGQVLASPVCCQPRSFSCPSPRIAMQEPLFLGSERADLIRAANNRGCLLGSGGHRAIVRM